MTGHTGFKGAWLSLWLHRLGAEVHGLALDPPTSPSLFEQARVTEHLATDERLDIRDADGVARLVDSLRPSIVLHLAAQPLVRDGYRRPGETFGTNLQGTVNLLDAIRGRADVGAVVVVTTDKVYRPAGAAGAVRAHVEDDALGGEDPYSWSKVMVEHATSAYRTLPQLGDVPGWDVPIATARAGNVVGGGDWSFERLVPDCIRAFTAGEAVELRYPDAVRPWQHVLDPLAGYLVLAESLLSDRDGRFSRAFNFGPSADSAADVGSVAERLATLWGGSAVVRALPTPDAPHENPALLLDSSLAGSMLRWSPRWDLDTTFRRTVDWYRRVEGGEDARSVMISQISEYVGGDAEAGSRG